ncbi:hypothetical protein NT6N_05130 [Oceaniferula spumae]|uniref:Uncharacterized protein n=1 Tax=Oceaniferula spumae TaxID=2979115 RepID=A0AAT9FHP5_9BACT
MGQQLFQAGEMTLTGLLMGMRFSYPPSPERIEHDAKFGVEATYYVGLITEERKVEWTVYLHLPEGMHWKKGDEMGLGSTHHEKTQSFEDFLSEPFRELPEELNFVRKYVQKQVGDSPAASELPPLRYDGFPRGGDEIRYKIETQNDGIHVTYYVTPCPYEGCVRWSFFPHLPEGVCAKKGDESGLGGMHSDGEQSIAEFKKSPKYHLPDEVHAMVMDKMNGWPS